MIDWSGALAAIGVAALIAILAATAVRRQLRGGGRVMFLRALKSCGIDVEAFSRVHLSTQLARLVRSCSRCRQQEACWRWYEAGNQGYPPFCPHAALFETWRIQYPLAKPEHNRRLRLTAADVR